jgi:prolyl 4-hydroxylase
MKEVVYSEMPRVTVYEDVVDHEFCDYIINKFTKAGMNPRAGWESYQQSDGQVHEGIEQRNISWDTPQEIREFFWAIITRVTGVPRTHIEAGDIYRYDEGQFFDLHVDYPLEPKKINYYTNGGDRKHTAIFYLNDNFEGGEFYFPILGFSIKPKKGSMAWIEYDYPDESINQSSVHESTIITKGEKWICATFIANGPRVE